jgi:hypothetical protein
MSFDNWTSISRQYAFAGLCGDFLNINGKLIDHPLGLPELHGAQHGHKIAAIAITILWLFSVDNTCVGYFELDNLSSSNCQ